MAALALVFLVTACGSGGADGADARSEPPSRYAPVEVGVPDPVIAPPVPAPPCDPSRSLTPITPPRPGGTMPAGSTMRAIQERGRLVVGVDQNTRMFSARSAGTGELEGFDIELAREVAKAIFGDPDRIQFRTIPPGRRIDVLVDGQADMVVDAMTITCERRQQVEFSGVYLDDALRFLVPRGTKVASLADLAGKYVCVSANTTPERRVAESKARVYAVADRTDCLVALQEGRVAAAYTNASLLESLREQDPWLEVVGPTAVEEVKGIAVPKGQTDFVRFLNGVLEQLKSSGRWQQLYDEWLGKALGPAKPPATTYGG
ncbi:glutamate ABC transporter substrate-binding protein [Embleya sp. NBC_00888]|uniref:glutamate ABC transporter substrate-binding protein n=1 Tax=Embleya sp. NBC_00888 TaxID=2975960 RepID=UPI00386F8AD1|nr:glutamate ABC transporter substrate-binding protein [Embleya sp. NBC_00888]